MDFLELHGQVTSWVRIGHETVTSLKVHLHIAPNLSIATGKIYYRASWYSQYQSPGFVTPLQGTGWVPEHFRKGVLEMPETEMEGGGLPPPEQDTLRNRKQLGQQNVNRGISKPIICIRQSFFEAG